MGFTKFCAALLNHPDPELQAIPRSVLEQVQYSLYPLFPQGAPGSFLSVSAPWGKHPSGSWDASVELVQTGALLAGQLQVPGDRFPATSQVILVLCQGLEALSGPRSSSITRRAAGFPMLFLCIVSGEPPAQARPLLTRCIQTLLTLAATALPQDWDQTLDLPQVSVAAGTPLGTG